MSLNSFREILIKKCEDESLKNLIKFVREDVLTELVFESLEKMADAKHKGDTANVALRNFGSEMDPETHPAMIRDALGHHASRYKAALKSGRQDLANSHAKQFFHIVNLAKKAQKHSDGKLDVSAVSPHAWERNAKTSRYEEDHPKVLSGSRDPGDFKTDTKGWSYAGKDYSFLQQAPHESYHDEIRRHGHNDAYPMEHTRVNGKYIHIEDVPADELHGYSKHEFDHHPILMHGVQAASKRTPEDDVKYDKQAMDFEDSHHMDKYWDRHEALSEANPEGYASRGSKVSDPVHSPVDNPLDIGSKKPQTAAPKSPQSEPQQEKLTDDEFKSHISSLELPDHIKSAILEKLGGK